MIPAIYWQFVRRWFWLLALGLILGAVTFYLYQTLGPVKVELTPRPRLRLVGIESRPVLYRSSVDILLKDALPSLSGAGGSKPTALSDQAALLAKGGKTERLLQSLAKQLPDHLQLSPDQLSKMLVVESRASPALVRFTAISDNKETATTVVTLAARLFVDQVIAEEKVKVTELLRSSREQLQTLQESLDKAMAEKQQLRERILARVGQEFTLARTEPLQALTAEIQRAKALLASAQDKELESLKKALEASLAQVKAAEAGQAKALSAEIKAALGTVSRAPERADYLLAEARVSASSRTVRSLADKIVSIEATLVDTGDKATQIDQERKELKAQLQQAQAALDQAVAERQRLQEQIVVRAGEEFTLAQSQNLAALITEIRAVKDLLAGAKGKEVEPLKKDLEASLARLEAAEAGQAKALSAEIKTALGTVSRAPERTDYLLAEARVSAYSRTVRSLADKIVSLEISSVDTGDKAAQIEQERKELTAQLQQVQVALDQAVAERLRLREQLVYRAEEDFLLSQSPRVETLIEQVKNTNAVLTQTVDKERKTVRGALETSLARIQAAEAAQSKALATAVDRALAKLASLAETNDYIAVDARIAAYTAEVRKVAPRLASVQAVSVVTPQQYLALLEAAKPTVVPEDVSLRKRDILVLGGGGGLVIAWFIAGLLQLLRERRQGLKQTLTEAG